MSATGIRVGGRAVNFSKALVVAVTVLIVGVVVMLETPSREAEKTAIHLTLNQLRAALVVKGAEIRLASGKSDYASWRGINPMTLLAAPIRNYDGVCDGNEPDTGRWCFDTKHQQGVLHYRPSQPLTLGTDGGKSAAMLTWRVEPEYTDLNGNGRLDDVDRQTGLKLVLIESNDDRGQSRP